MACRRADIAVVGARSGAVRRIRAPHRAQPPDLRQVAPPSEEVEAIGREDLSKVPGPRRVDERDLDRGEDAESPHPGDLVVAQHDQVFQARSEPPSPAPVEGALERVEDLVRRPIAARVGGDLPSRVVDPRDEPAKGSSPPVELPEASVVPRLAQVIGVRVAFVDEELGPPQAEQPPSSAAWIACSAVETP
ncbi:MAG TPA: hypothetical protein VF129_14065 [Actinomycetota bacterium]